MRRLSLADSSTDSLWIGNRVKTSEQTIQNRVGKTPPQDCFWWSATDGGAVIADAAPTKKQAVADIGDEFRLAAAQRLQLAKYHIIEVHGWRIALQKPDESCDDFLDRSCGQKTTAVRVLPAAPRRPQQRIHSTKARA